MKLHGMDQTGLMDQGKQFNFVKQVDDNTTQLEKIAW